MNPWLLLIPAWPLLTVLTGRRLYSMFRYEEVEDGITWDIEDRTFIGAICTVAGIFWPIVGLWVLVTMNPPKTPRELKDARDAEAKEREEHISRLQRENDQLERALKLGDHR